MRWRVGFAAALIVVSIGADAQDPGLEPVDPTLIPVEIDSGKSEAVEATVLDDIVVTATKREEFARDIAGSLTVLDGRSLEDRGAREQEDYLRLVPGVSLYKEEPNRQRVTIRGIAADNGTSQASGTLIDDTPFTDPFIADLSPDLAPFDLSTVEVLKGPTGTLFGGSGLAGAIRYNLQQAELGEWQARGYVATTDVSHGGREPAYGAAINAPVHDVLALRLVGTRWDRPGVIDETGRGEADVDRSSQESYRAMARLAATDRLEIRATHLRQDTATADLGFVDDRSGELTRDSTPTASRIGSAFTLDQLTLNYDFDQARLTAVGAHLTKDLDVDADSSRSTPGTRQLAQAAVDGYTQELRVASMPDESSRFHWLLGVFRLDYDTARRVDVVSDTATVAGTPLPQTPFIPGTVGLTGGDTGLVVRFDLDATALELAAFGEGTLELTPRADVTLGVRAYRTSSVGTATSSGPLNVALTGEQEARNDARIEEDGYCPKAALRYRWSEDVMVYGLASKGYRFGGIALIGDTPTDDIPPTYKSDSLWLYELGTRTRWFGQSLTLDAALFQSHWSDPQITQLTQSGTLLYIDNAGAVRVRGGELALRYLTQITGLGVGATAAYTDARTVEPFTAASGENVPAGARWPFSADRQLTADVAYNLDLSAWSINPSVVYGYIGPGFSNIENTVPVFDYATLDVNLRIASDALPGAPSLQISGSNVLDERGVASDSLANGVHTIYFVRPFSVTASLELRF